MSLKPPYREEYADIIRAFIAENVKDAGAKGTVVGLSGGMDSSTVAKLCADALGKDKVLALVMPERETSPEDTQDAAEFAENLGIKYENIDITNSVDAFSSVFKGSMNKKMLGNIKARCRMVILYCHANAHDFLVMGTSNKSELLVGYFTKFGDGAADLLPLGGLYKTQVYELAGSIGIPEKILQKVPSAGLWKGQTDESELKIGYEELDQILYGFELGLSHEGIADRTGLPMKEIARVHELTKRSVHKRELPLAPKFESISSGLD